MRTKTIDRAHFLKTSLSAALLAFCFGCASPTGVPADPAAAAGGEFLRACSQEDWDKVEQFYLGILPQTVKERFGSAELLHVGRSFERPRRYDGRFVPYKVRFKTGAVVNGRLSMKPSPAGWQVDGGL
jgi:hypothetical protein